MLYDRCGHDIFKEYAALLYKTMQTVGPHAYPVDIAHCYAHLVRIETRHNVLPTPLDLILVSSMRGILSLRNVVVSVNGNLKEKIGLHGNGLLDVFFSGGYLVFAFGFSLLLLFVLFPHLLMQVGTPGLVSENLLWELPDIELAEYLRFFY